MKSIISLTSLSFFLFNLAYSETSRIWTSTSGSTIKAQLTDFSDRTVVLKSDEGKRISLRLEQLSNEDQIFVLQATEQKAKKTRSSSTSYSSKSPSNVELSSGLAELLPKKILKSNGSEVSSSVLSDKVVGFYFSAHWCPPCRTFTPKLVDFRDQNKNDFEVVFVSSDRDSSAQMGYMKETNMKWYTLPLRSKEANALAQKYKIRGIPALIIVSPDGKTITTNGRGEVTSNPSGAIKSWKKS